LVAVWGKNRCLLPESCVTDKHTVWA